MSSANAGKLILTERTCTAFIMGGGWRKGAAESLGKVDTSSRERWTPPAVACVWCAHPTREGQACEGEPPLGSCLARHAVANPSSFPLLFVSSTGRRRDFDKRGIKTGSSRMLFRGPVRSRNIAFQFGVRSTRDLHRALRPRI